MRVRPMLAARHDQPHATRVARPLLCCRHHCPADAQTPRILSHDERSDQANRPRGVENRMPRHGEKSQRSTRIVNLQECSASFGEHCPEAR